MWPVIRFFLERTSDARTSGWRLITRANAQSVNLDP
jgi:hypothetical protein